MLRRGGRFRAGSYNFRCPVRLPRSPNFVDGPEYFLAVAQRNPEFFEIVFGQIRKDGVVDIRVR